jgi:hypothetical protein
MDAEQYLKDRVDDQINWYDNKSLYNQRWFKRLRVSEVVCAVFIPFLSGYIHVYQIPITFVIGALGVVIAVIAGLLSLYQFQEIWVQYRTVCESLKKEKFLYLTCSEPYNCNDEERLQTLVHRVETLISKENTNWAQYMIKPKTEEKKCLEN